MERREFLIQTALAAAGVWLGTESARAEQKKPEGPERGGESTPELRENTPQAEGEAVLQRMARTPKPAVRTAAYGKTKTEGGWFFGESQKVSERPKFLLYANNFSPEFLHDASELWLYRVGPGKLPETAKTYEVELRNALQRKDLLTDATWIAYLPDLEYADWEECELLVNAYFAFRTQGVVRNVIVTPYGKIEFHIQPASSFWSEYHGHFEKAQEVLDAVRGYGEPFAEEFGDVSFNMNRDPVNRLKGTLLARATRASMDAANDTEDAHVAREQERFLYAQIRRLTLAQNQFKKAFYEPRREFDIRKAELESLIHQGQYETLDALMTAVEQLYTTIDVGLTFVPAPDLLPPKR